MHVYQNATDSTYTVGLNAAEYQVFKKILSRLIFNPEGVSNQFKLSKDEISVIRKMNGTLYGIRY
jgi:hypothetical protein